MKELCVVYLVRYKNDLEQFQHFLDSYQRNAAGVEHDFLIVFKGFSQSEDLGEYRKILKSFTYISYEISDEGFDLTAYFSAAKTFGNQYRFFCFFNSFSEILDEDWLLKLYQPALMQDVGIVGASGSLQSHRKGSQLSLIKEVYIVSKNHFKLYEKKVFLKQLILSMVAGYDYCRSQLKLGFFPNCHIRTNAFVISSNLMKSLSCPLLKEKMDAYTLESGRGGISRQIISMRKRLILVGKDGKFYDEKDWYKSNTFWQSNQENLLIADNQTRDYQYGTLERRRFLSTSAWGASIKIAEGIDFSAYPKISVCIPVRNGGKYLNIAIDSVLRQTYTQYELIVIDNASSDDTAQLVEQFATKNSKIKLFKHEKNIGLIENFNACLYKATGEYIKFLCADDVLMPNCLEQMLCAFEANKSASLVTVGRLLVNQQDDVLALKNYSKDEVLVGGKEAINRCLFGTNSIGEPSATMFRRRALEEGFDVNLPHLVDLEMWFRLLEQGDLVSIPQPLCSIRRHELQMTRHNIQSGMLIEDNVRLFDMYKDKPYIKHTWLIKVERKMRMAYRVWICRKSIKNERKIQVLKLQSSLFFYYLLIPILSFVLYIARKLNHQISSMFLVK